MKRIFFLLFLVSGCASAAMTAPVKTPVPAPEPTLPIVLQAKTVVPVNSLQYFPYINDLLDSAWSTLKHRSVIPAVVEQETCITLKHKSCWNPKAQLKTKREYGFGFGQITIAYNVNGTERFNNFIDIKKQDSELKQWKWEDRFNPNYQLRALTVQYRNTFNRVKWAMDNELERLAFTDSSYNGGFGGVLQDRKKTIANGGNPDLWFGENNVAANSYKTKKAVSGYGKSFYEINREHVDNVINKRRIKYIGYMKEKV